MQICIIIKKITPNMMLIETNANYNIFIFAYKYNDDVAIFILKSRFMTTKLMQKSLLYIFTEKKTRLK